jgi:hypothetical protein
MGVPPFFSQTSEIIMQALRNLVLIMGALSSVNALPLPQSYSAFDQQARESQYTMEEPPASYEQQPPYSNGFRTSPDFYRDLESDLKQSPGQPYQQGRDSFDPSCSGPSEYPTPYRGRHSGYQDQARPHMYRADYSQGQEDMQNTNPRDSRQPNGLPFRADHRRDPKAKSRSSPNHSSSHTGTDNGTPFGRSAGSSAFSGRSANFDSLTEDNKKLDAQLKSMQKGSPKTRSNGNSEGFCDIMESPAPGSRSSYRTGAEGFDGDNFNNLRGKSSNDLGLFSSGNTENLNSLLGTGGETQNLAPLSGLTADSSSFTESTAGQSDGLGRSLVGNQFIRQSEDSNSGKSSFPQVNSLESVLKDTAGAAVTTDNSQQPTERSGLTTTNMFGRAFESSNGSGDTAPSQDLTTGASVPPNSGIDAPASALTSLGSTFEAPKFGRDASTNSVPAASNAITGPGLSSNPSVSPLSTSNSGPTGVQAQYAENVNGQQMITLVFPPGWRIGKIN